MGVFARFRKKSNSAENEPTAEVPAAATEGAEEAATDAVTGSAGAATTEPDPAPESADEAVAGVAGVAAVAEEVDIPRQQSAQGAADNETGEGART